MAVFAAGPPRVTCLSCALEVGKMRELWSSPVLSSHLSIYPAHAIPAPHLWFLEGTKKSAPGYLYLKSCISQTSSDGIISSVVLCLCSLTLSFLFLSLFLPPSLLFPDRYLKGTATTTLPSLGPWSPCCPVSSEFTQRGPLQLAWACDLSSLAARLKVNSHPS